MKKCRWIAAAFVSVVLFVMLAYFAGWLLTPPRLDFGCMWDAYREEEKDSIDVMFFGTSLTYCDVVPSVIWEETGVTSYVMGGGEQTLLITYGFIKEALRTQSPKVIAVEVSGLFYPQYGEATKVNISYMPWSKNRVETIVHAAEPELRAGLLFPLFDYHSYWRNATISDYAKRLDPDVDLLAGYNFLSRIRPQDKDLEREFDGTPEDYTMNLAHLQKIVDYCEDSGVQLLCFLSPTYRRIPEDKIEQLTEDVTAIEGVVFKNFHEDWTEIGIDNSNDWYDTAHFNCWGAEKFSRYLSGYLMETFSLEPTEDADVDLWSNRVETFENRKQLVETE